MPASGPYRSRLFNVLHRQTRQWADQSAQVWRHFKVATLWSVQLLLYPVYWAFQTGRVIGKQLQQAERQVAHFRLQLEARRQQQPPLTADTAIHSVLQAVQTIVAPTAPPPLAPPALPDRLTEGETLTTGVSPANPSLPTPSMPSVPTLQPNAIRAIASLVATRTLVLVTAQNQILDILTPQQQQWLYQRLADEVARYRRYQQVAQTPHWQFQVRLFPPRLRQTQFPPVRYFRALMGWMQQGPVAKLTNLFDEATLLTDDRWDLANLLTLPALPTLGQLEGTTHPTPALPPPPSWLGTLPQSASTLIQALLHQEVTHTASPVAAIAIDLQWEAPTDLWANPPTLPEQAAPAQATLGIPCPFPPSSSVSVPPALPPSPGAAARPMPPSLLPRWPGLRASKPATRATDPPPITQWQAIVRLITATPVGPSLPVAQAQLFTAPPAQRSLPQPPTPPASLIPPSPVGPLPVPTPSATSAIAATPTIEAIPTALESQETTDTAPVPTPSLLEVEAQILGYVKHPLEHVLEWLDQIMLWLETALGRLWRWLQTRLPQL